MKHHRYYQYEELSIYLKVLLLCLFAAFKGSENKSVLLAYQCISLFTTLLMLSVGNRVAATVDSTVSGLIQSNG